ncbi:hypothetical protein [Bradyrhizobium sp. USDA 3262]|nr:hypothetical protein QIH80_22870 [Bradyrhizobium elkanii]
MALADVTLADVLSLAGPLIAVAGAISGVWYRMETKVESVRKDAADSIHSVEKELSNFKMKVVEEYASWDTVRAIETRLTERMDGLSNQVMAMPDAVVDRITKFLNLKSA